MPFRDAHHVTGRIVAKAAAEHVALHELPLAALQAIEKRITKDVFAVPVEKLDTYRAKQPNAPIFVYIHGGAWLGDRSGLCLTKES
jgi:argininosuccinate lyase